jgi:hypothetical protein
MLGTLGTLGMLVPPESGFVTGAETGEPSLVASVLGIFFLILVVSTPVVVGTLGLRLLVGKELPGLVVLAGLGLGSIVVLVPVAGVFFFIDPSVLTGVSDVLVAGSVVVVPVAGAFFFIAPLILDGFVVALERLFFFFLLAKDVSKDTVET